MRVALALAVALAGCYAPDPPSGSFLCSADQACPDGLACACGQCVSDPSLAACAFAITSSKDPRQLAVEEHERFPITIQAFNAAGQPASQFQGEVKISSTWGDVCVGTGSCSGLPDRVALAGGVATDVQVQLNRETIPPQSAILRAEFAGNVGTSGKLRINVAPPVFARDAQPVVAPLQTDYSLSKVTPQTTFGFAQVIAAAPAVVKVADGWRMYFGGAIVKSMPGADDVHGAVGVAASTDGKAFTAPATPLFETVAGPTTSTGFVSALPTADDTRLFVGRGQAFPTGAAAAAFAFSTIARMRVTSTLGPFAFDADPVISIGASADPMTCSYCAGVDAPVVLADPNGALYGGGPNAQLMYFSSVQRTKDENGKDTISISVVRASSLDGEKFEVDPSPVLKSDRDEVIIYSPRVLLDGSVYKMFYSVVGFDITRPLTNLSDPCDAQYHVGYATSSDGYYWVRSPRNSPSTAGGLPPVFDVDKTAGGWEAGGSILVSSVVAADGVDPSNGVALYYSPFLKIGPATQKTCAPNGIGRAVRR